MRCWEHTFRILKVLLLAGPDKGKTGYMIGLENSVRADAGQPKAIIKLETSTALGGIREIKASKISYVKLKGVRVVCYIRVCNVFVSKPPSKWLLLLREL